MDSKNSPAIVKEPVSDEMLEKLFIKGLALFFIVIAVYIPAMWGDYIYDDDQLLYVNQNITKGQGFDKESWKGFANIWVPLDARGSGDYFPATSTVFWLEWRIFGNDTPNTLPH
jgi:hypothetical protein